MRFTQEKSILKGRYLLFLSLIFLVGAATPARSERGKHAPVVLTGSYRCPGNFPGFLHSITFTASDLGELHIETQFSNLDTGNCTPRGEDARTLAQGLGCTVGPLYPFQPGGGAGSAFGFVCQGDRDTIVNIIGAVSKEVLRPTQ